ncbi:MAG: LysR family transcriptional regulator [Micromonosporaceae bacterium]
MELDVRRLRVLREVALRGTITAAAEALGYTPSAISQQLSALERECATVLLERAGRRVRLTEAGRSLVSHTEPVLAALEEARAALEEARDTIAGDLRVAAAGSVARALVIPVAAALGAERPRLRVTVHEYETDEGLRDLRLGGLDAVVAHEYDQDRLPPEPEVARFTLFTEEMAVAAPAGRFAAGPVAIADLAGEIWAAEPAGATCGRAARAACRAAGFEPDVRYISSEPGVVLSAVQAAGAVALMPRLSLAEPPPGVDILPVVGPGARRTVFAARRRGSASRPGIALLLSRLRSAARDIGAPTQAAV